MLASFQTHGNTSRVVEVWQGIDKLGLMFPEDVFKLVSAHSIIIKVYRHELRSVCTPGLDSAQVGWLLNQDGVSRVNHEPPDQIKRLLGSAGDE